MNVSFQGDYGAFSHVIATKLYPNATFLSCKNFQSIFKSIQQDQAEYGILPIENTQTGKITNATQILIDSNLSICNEAKLKIIHCLISKESQTISKIKKIYAHPEALSQCSIFLSNMSCEQISWYDGAAAAKIIKQQKETALIASEEAAKLYDLNIMKKGIQNSKNNITRFLVISKNKPAPTGNDKTSIVLYVSHTPGALLDVLKPFQKNNINLTRIESIPLPEQPWKYLFLIDFEGHKKEGRINEAISKLEQLCKTVKILGSYPIGKYYH